MKRFRITTALCAILCSPLFGAALACDLDEYDFSEEAKMLGPEHQLVNVETGGANQTFRCGACGEAWMSVLAPGENPRLRPWWCPSCGHYQTVRRRAGK